MRFLRSNRVIHTTIFCLVFALFSGCKTTGAGRHLADTNEGIPSKLPLPHRSEKRRWSTLALAAVGIAVGAFGSVRLSKYLLKSDFDKQLGRHLNLLKKQAKNPNDKAIKDELEKNIETMDKLIENANSKEIADGYQKKFDESVKKLEESGAYRGNLIKNTEEELAQLEAGEMDDKIFADVSKMVRTQIPNPRDTYKSFEDYLDAQQHIKQIREAGQQVPEEYVDAQRRIWDDYDAAIEEAAVAQVPVAKKTFKNILQDELDNLKNAD